VFEAGPDCSSPLRAGGGGGGGGVGGMAHESGHCRAIRKVLRRGGAIAPGDKSHSDGRAQPWVSGETRPLHNSRKPR